MQIQRYDTLGGIKYGRTYFLFEGLCCLSWIVYDNFFIGLLAEWYNFREHSIKIKYSDFRKWYAISPDSWVTDSGCLSKRLKLHETVYCYFNFFSYLRYLIWLHNRKIRDKNKDNLENKKLLLMSVQEDIDDCFREIEKNNKIAAREIKRVKENLNGVY